MCHTSAKAYTVKGVYWSFTDLPTPKRQKMWYSEPELGKKWEMGKKSWEISVSLWVLEVTISLKAGAVNMTINFQFRFCKFCVLLAPFWNKRNSKSTHLVAAASCAVAKRIVAFDYILLLFSLGWAGCLLISNLETNPTAPKCFLRNHLPTRESVRQVLKSSDSRQSRETWQVYFYFICFGTRNLETVWGQSVVGQFFALSPSSFFWILTPRLQICQPVLAGEWAIPKDDRFIQVWVC